MVVTFSKRTAMFRSLERTCCSRWLTLRSMAATRDTVMVETIENYARTRVTMAKRDLTRRFPLFATAMLHLSLRGVVLILSDVPALPSLRTAVPWAMGFR